MNSLGNIVRQHRKLSGLTQTELARLAGVGKTVVHELESGKTTVRFDIILKVLKTLNVTLEFRGPRHAQSSPGPTTPPTP